MYDPREILKRSPADIAGAVIVLLNVLVLTKVIEISTEALGGINIAIVTVLTLFYVKPSTISRTNLQSLQDAVDEATEGPITAKKIAGRKAAPRKQAR